MQYYVDLFKKVQATPEWKELMEHGAFNTTSLEGKEYADWVAREEARHVALMKAAGSSPASKPAGGRGGFGPALAGSWDRK